MIDEFESYLKQSNLSENTISSYLFTLKQFVMQQGDFTLKTYVLIKHGLLRHISQKL